MVPSSCVANSFVDEWEGALDGLLYVERLLEAGYPVLTDF